VYNFDWHRKENRNLFTADVVWFSECIPVSKWLVSFASDENPCKSQESSIVVAGARYILNNCGCWRKSASSFSSPKSLFS
jgi:hypothetical protein